MLLPAGNTSHHIPQQAGPYSYVECVLFLFGTYIITVLGIFHVKKLLLFQYWNEKPNIISKKNQNKTKRLTSNGVSLILNYVVEISSNRKRVKQAVTRLLKQGFDIQHFSPNP